MDYEYDTQKVCPVDGHIIGPFEAVCYDYDCSNRAEDKYYMLHGRKCHCSVEAGRIEKEYKKQLTDKRKKEEMEVSREEASKIAIDEFYDYCRSLIKKLTKTKQKYGPEMVIKPYHKDDEKWLIVLFEGDEMAEIAASGNALSYISSKLDKLTGDETDYSIGMCIVPEYLAEAVVTKLKLNRRMDVSRNVSYDNPVYVKRKDIAKYVKAAYGYEWWDFDKLRKNHLELTEIVNYGSVIYLKPEIDHIIKCDNLLKGTDED